MKYFSNNSFLRKKIADSPLYRSKIRNLPKSEENKKRLAIYNTLKKDKDAVFTFYHGTSVSIWKDIQERGYFTSPTIRNLQQRENRSKGLEEVFFTTSVDYASFYANRAKQQTNTQGIILELKIPLYHFKEITDVILGEDITAIYNEYDIPLKVKEILDANDLTETTKIADEIKKFVVYCIKNKESNEFTIKHAISTRFVSGTSFDSKSLWARWIEERPTLDTIQHAKILFGDDEQISKSSLEALIKYCKEDPVEYYRHAQELFPNNKAILDATKEGYINLLLRNPETTFYSIAKKIFPNDKDIYEAFRNGYIDLLKRTYGRVRQPAKFYFDQALQLFPDDAKINALLKEIFIKHKESLHSLYYAIRKVFPNDAEIYEAGKYGFIAELRSHFNPDLYKLALDTFANDDEIVAAGKESVIEYVELAPWFRYAEAKNLFPDLEESFNAIIKRRLLGEIKSGTIEYSRIRDVLRLLPKESDILEIVKEMYFNKIGYCEPENAYYMNQWYEEAIKLFPNDKQDFDSAHRQGWLHLLAQNPDFYKYAVHAFGDDKNNYNLYYAHKKGWLTLVQNFPAWYPKAIQLFPEAKEEFDEAAGKTPQEPPKQACGWYNLIKTF